MVEQVIEALKKYKMENFLDSQILTDGSALAMVKARNEFEKVCVKYVEGLLRANKITRVPAEFDPKNIDMAVLPSNMARNVKKIKSAGIERYEVPGLIITRAHCSLNDAPYCGYWEVVFGSGDEAEVDTYESKSQSGGRDNYIGSIFAYVQGIYSGHERPAAVRGVSIDASKPYAQEIERLVGDNAAGRAVVVNEGNQKI